MKDLKIVPPEGYEVDKENSTFDTIVFKKKLVRPVSWAELIMQSKKIGYYIDDYSEIACVDRPNTMRDYNFDRNLLPSKELAESFLALMQLMSLRDMWLDGWKCDDWKFCPSTIGWQDGKLIIYDSYVAHPLHFPKKKMAQEFLECFKDLCEKAKYLL